LTQTIQLYSPVVLNDTGGADNTEKLKLEAEDIRLLALLLNSLNDLCKELCKLDHVLERKNMEQVMYRRYKGERK